MKAELKAPLNNLAAGTDMPAILTGTDLADGASTKRVLDVRSVASDTLYFPREVYSLDSDSITLAAANATKSALGTVKLVNGFFNPAASGRNCLILAAYVATTSGTPAGPYFYNYYKAAVALTSASTGTIQVMPLGSAASVSVVTPQVNVAVTFTGGPTTALTQFAVFGGPAAVVSGAGLDTAIDNVNGLIVVPPGVLFGILATGAGTSHVVQSTLRWKEIPV